MKANRVTIVLETGDGEDREIRDLLEVATDGTGWEVSGYATGDHLMAQSTLKRAMEALEQARSLVGACVEPEPEPEALAWPGPWEKHSDAGPWSRWWPSGSPAVDQWGRVFPYSEDGMVGIVAQITDPASPAWPTSGVRTAETARAANKALATICRGEDPHPIPAEVLGEEAPDGPA